MILGKGFRGALNYVSAAAKSATTDHKGSVPAFFTNMAGRGPRELAAEFGTLRKLRPNLTKAVGHLILSHDPAQRLLTESEWKSAIQIALFEHGADQAAFAVWQHFDTDASHCHVIFSRVLTTNEVVSDSNSYRKNERAARLIERTFMLDTPTPTPAADKPGDRKAIYNAQKRAERTGIPDPTLVSPQIVREALAAAKNIEEYQRQLEDRDIEIEFDRRGVEQEIYGCRLRRRGTTEWLKASSVHKDLSWPKIAHRFVESDSAKDSPAEQTVAPPQTAPAAPTQQNQIAARAPQQLQQIPQVMHTANQLTQPGPVVNRLREVSERLDEMLPAISTSMFLNATWALSKVAIFCAIAAANIAAAVWRFVQRLLNFLGLKTRPLQYEEQAVTHQLTYEPMTHGRMLEQDELAELDKNAASAIDHVLECVKSGRPDDLPNVAGAGRAELIEAMTTNPKIGTPAAAKVHPSDSMFDNHQTQPAPKSETTTSEPDTFNLLSKATTEFFNASLKKSEARERETEQVAAARKKLATAELQLSQTRVEYNRQKEQKGIFKRFFPTEEKALADEQNSVVQATKILAEARAKYPTVAPLELVQKYETALDKVKAAAAAHHAQMVRAADRHASVKVKKVAAYQAESFRVNFELFERAPIVGYLHAAFETAKSAHNLIAAAQTLAEHEDKTAAQRQDYVPADEQHGGVDVDVDDRPGQR